MKAGQGWMLGAMCALAVGCTASSDSDEIAANLREAGYADNDIAIIRGAVFVGGDAEVSLDASREMIASAPGLELYRTTNIVGPSVTTICVNGAAYTGAFSTALNRALARYNALGLRWHMTRTTGATTGCNAVITMKLTAGSNASSGFPSGGLPYNAITLGSGLGSLDIPTLSYIVMHEFGHAVGLRHADYFDPTISCGAGGPGPEAAGGVGAILIPGTPTGYPADGSIMKTCRQAVEVDQFRPYDIIALNAMY